MPLVILDGSREFINSIADNFSIILEQLKDYPKVIVVESDVLKVDAGIDRNGLHIICDEPTAKNLKTLIEFANMQLQTLRDLKPSMDMILKLHLSYLRGIFNKYKEEIFAILEDYDEFMKRFLEMLISSAFKFLTLEGMDAAKIEALKAIRGMTDPFKVNSAKLLHCDDKDLCVSLADNIWREKLGWRIPKDIRSLRSVKVLRETFYLMVEALESRGDSRSYQRAAWKLTEFTLGIFGIKIQNNKLGYTV